MQQNQIHTLDPSLRSTTLSSPPKSKSQQYQDAVHPQAYSPLQPSPNNSYQSIQTPSYYGGNHPVQDSPEEGSPGGPAGQDSNDLKRPRACEACRQLKVKCEIDDNSPTGGCKRCAKAHRQCIVTIPSRKRQKKTDSRVAELEKKIDALTATLAARGGTESDASLDPAIAHHHYQVRHSVYGDNWNGQQAPPMSHSPPHPTPNTGLKRKTADTYGPFGGELQKPSVSTTRASSVGPGHLSATDSRQQRASVEPPVRDVIDRGLIDQKTAYRCFDRYHNEMCKLLPVVSFPEGTKAEEIRRSKPALFQAIVAVACGTIRPDLQSRITSDATRVLAERIIYSGEKSIELVQTIQIMTVFYQPPEKYEELNFNQLVHIAAVMALDIGMGKRTKKGTPPAWKGFMEKTKGLPDPNAVETRRCWLGCYYMCSNSAMSLRRPLLLRWSPYADECIELLQTAPDALPTDRWLCHIVQAQHIAEMIGTEFAMDDPAKELSLTDPTVQLHLKALVQKVERWAKDGEEFMHSPVMKHTRAIITLYMHEIAMHNEHNIDDFRPPYSSTPIEGPPNPESVTPTHISCLGVCLESAHEAFDAFLSMDIDLLRALPTHFFVRNSYAAVALIKLYTATAARETKVGAIFAPDKLKVDYYLDRLISVLTKVAEGGVSKVAMKFSMIFHMLQRYHLKRAEPPSSRGSREQSQTRMPSKGTTVSKSSSYNNNSVPTSNDIPPPPAPPQHLSQSQPSMTPHPSHMWQQQPSQNQIPPPSQKMQRSGLQMLSDAAMAPASRQQHHNTGQNQWLSSPPPPQPQNNHLSPGPPHLGPGPLQPGMVDLNVGGISMAVDPMMAASYGMAPDQMTLMDFTSDELMAYGFGDEFLAMNFGFDQGGGWPI